MKLFCIGFLLFFSCYLNANEQVVVNLNGQQFVLEMALTPDQQYQGLSDRTDMGSNEGMIFIFDHSEIRTFLMRRCHFPIDLIFLDHFGVIIDLFEMHVEPFASQNLAKYKSSRPAKYAIELKGNTLRYLGLVKGQKIDLSFL